MNVDSLTDEQLDKLIQRAADDEQESLLRNLLEARRKLREAYEQPPPQARTPRKPEPRRSHHGTAEFYMAHPANERRWQALIEDSINPITGKLAMTGAIVQECTNAYNRYLEQLKGPL